MNEVKLQCIKQEKFYPVCFVLGAGIKENNILDSMFLKGLKWVKNCVGYKHIKQQTACACYVELRFVSIFRVNYSLQRAV